MSQMTHLTQMTQRKALVGALMFLALSALLAVAIEFKNHRRLDAISLSITVGAAAGAIWVYTRTVG